MGPRPTGTETGQMPNEKNLTWVSCYGQHMAAPVTRRIGRQDRLQDQCRHSKQY